MASPVQRAATAPVITTGAVSSPSATQVGDLLIFYCWTQGAAGFPAHTLQSGFFEWFGWDHDDGSTDGRFTVAVKEAAVAGAQSYTPYSISGGTANGTSIGIVVLQAGTWNASLTSEAPAKQAAASQTNNSAPNPPALSGLTGDFLVHAVGCWHQGAAANTDANAPTNYTMRAENAPGTSHLAHLAICDRTLTGLSGASEDPGSITDNIAPNGTVGYTVAIPGAVSVQDWTQADIADATASALDPALAPAPVLWAEPDVASATASAVDPAFSPGGAAGWAAAGAADATASTLDPQLSAAAAGSWSQVDVVSAAAEGIGATFSVPPQPFAQADVADALATAVDPDFTASGVSSWDQAAPAEATAGATDPSFQAGAADWSAGSPAESTASAVDPAFSPDPTSWAVEPAVATAAGIDPQFTPGPTSWESPDVADASASVADSVFEEVTALTWGAAPPADAIAAALDPTLQPGMIDWVQMDVAEATSDAPAVDFSAPLETVTPGTVGVTSPCLHVSIVNKSTAGTVGG